MSGAALSNVFVSGAMSIAAVSTIGGHATFPLFIAAFLCFVPLAFAVWASTLDPQGIESMICAVVLSVFLLVTYANTHPVLQVMSGRQPLDEEAVKFQESRSKTTSSDMLNQAETGTSEDSTRAAGLGQSTTPALQAQLTEHYATSNESSSLLQHQRCYTLQTKFPSRQGSILVCSVFIMLCAAYTTTCCIRGIAGHNPSLEATPALVAGLTIAGRRALPVAHRMLLQPTTADFVAARNLYTYNLLLLATGECVALILLLNWASSSSGSPVFFVAVAAAVPILATLLATAAIWSDNLVWFLGLPSLVVSLLPLYLFLQVPTSYGHGYGPGRFANVHPTDVE